MTISEDTILAKKYQNLSAKASKFCEVNDTKCLNNFGGCTASCNQKCKVEPELKQIYCIKLCTNQCMAGYSSVTPKPIQPKNETETKTG